MSDEIPPAPVSIHDKQCAILLLGHIYRLLRWKYGYTGKPALPRGRTPEDVACDTLAALRNGTRAIRADLPLNDQLLDAARSALSSLHKIKGARTTSNDLELREPRLASAHPTPRESFETADAQENILALLSQHPLARENPDILKILQACAGGAKKPAEIIAASGLPKAKVYKLRQKLKTIYQPFRAQLVKQGAL